MKLVNDYEVKKKMRKKVGNVGVRSTKVSKRLQETKVGHVKEFLSLPEHESYKAGQNSLKVAVVVVAVTLLLYLASDRIPPPT